MAKAPHTPAAISDDVEEPTSSLDDVGLPPAPKVGTVFASLLFGSFVALMTMMMTGSTVTWWLRDLKKTADHVGNGAFSIISSLVVLMALHRWWGALRSQAQAGRWFGLSMPFFIVVGLAAGWGFAQGVLPAEERGLPGDWRDSSVCRELNARTEGGPGWRECLRTARKCQVETLAGSNRWVDFEDCVSSRWSPTKKR